MDTDDYVLTVADAARILDRSSDSVRAYERRGRLPAQRTAGGVRLFRLEDVERLRAGLPPRPIRRHGWIR
jgi:DNA-binding transcriptional MerR regulator